jgi:ketosteroid isomerase-like protein
MGELGNLHPEWVMFLQTYLTTYFTHRDLDGTLALLAPDLTGFGTGLDELGRHPQELRAMYARDLEQMQTPIACRVHWLEGRSLGPLSAVLFCVLSIEAMTENGTIAFDDLRLSLVIEKQAQGWVMVHHHLSAPTDRQESGESYPLRELRLFNEKLREEVRRKTVELEARNQSLEKALADVRTLSGLIPICASCKKIRDDKGYWNEVEEYIRAHSEAVFTHGICPTCLPNYFPKGSSR